MTTRLGPDAHYRPFRFSRELYLRMSDLGMFRDKKVQLIDGEIIEMPAQKNYHVQGTQALLDVLPGVFGPTFWVRCQATLDFSPHGMPEPDIAVITGNWRTHPNDGIPTAAVLVVEVSDSTLRDDRTYMMSLYAAAGVTDYWILNLVDRQLEVHRDAVADDAHLFGTRYGTVTILRAGDTVSPLAAAHAAIPVADLLP
jgi:Uma2 family endonuclease